MLNYEAPLDQAFHALADPTRRAIVARLGERRAAMLGMAVATLGFLGYAVLRDGTLVFVLLTFTGLQSIVQPAIMAMMSRRVAENQQGELQGLNGSGGGGGAPHPPPGGGPPPAAAGLVRLATPRAERG